MKPYLRHGATGERDAFWGLALCCRTSGFCKTAACPKGADISLQGVPATVVNPAVALQTLWVWDALGRKGRFCVDVHSKIATLVFRMLWKDTHLSYVQFWRTAENISFFKGRPWRLWESSATEENITCSLAFDHVGCENSCSAPTFGFYFFVGFSLLTNNFSGCLWF